MSRQVLEYAQHHIKPIQSSLVKFLWLGTVISIKPSTWTSVFILHSVFCKHLDKHEQKHIHVKDSTKKNVLQAAEDRDYGSESTIQAGN